MLKGLTLLVLFTSLFVCSFLVFKRAWPPPKKEAVPYTFGGIVFKYLKDAAKDLIPLIILVCTAWVLRRTGQLMNLAPPLIYFLVLISLVEAIRKARSGKPSAAD